MLVPCPARDSSERPDGGPDRVAGSGYTLREPIERGPRPATRIPTTPPSARCSARAIAVPARRSACVVVIHGEGLGRRADIDEAPVLVGVRRKPTWSSPTRASRASTAGSGAKARRLSHPRPGATNATCPTTAASTANPCWADGDQVTVWAKASPFISCDSVEARYHEEIYQLATHDADRISTTAAISSRWRTRRSRAMRHARPLSLCIVDVDLFAGQRPLRPTSPATKSCARSPPCCRHAQRRPGRAHRRRGIRPAVAGMRCVGGAGLADRLREAVAVAPFAPAASRSGSPSASAWPRWRPARCQARTDGRRGCRAVPRQERRLGRNRVCVEPGASASPPRPLAVREHQQIGRDRPCAGGSPAGEDVGW